MLQNPLYIGVMRQGRQRVISYKVHKRTAVPEDEWCVVENAVPAIIDREIFQAAQDLHKRDTKREVYLFSGFVRCADCGKSMVRHGRELYYHQRWEEALEVFAQFLEEGRGWVENNIDACCHCAYCQRELGHEQAALEALLCTFAYDWPRAEVCCEIGHCFFRKERFRQAAYWYTLALTCARDDRRGGFVSPDCYGYLPCIQLCVRYSRLGDQKKAETFNELAASCKPDSPAVRHNRAVFQALSEQTMQVG